MCLLRLLLLSNAQHEAQERHGSSTHQVLCARQHCLVKLLGGQASQPLQHVAAARSMAGQCVCERLGRGSTSVKE